VQFTNLQVPGKIDGSSSGHGQDSWPMNISNSGTDNIHLLLESFGTRL
jgi:hypothetical protein